MKSELAVFAIIVIGIVIVFILYRITNPICEHMNHHIILIRALVGIME